MRYGSTTRRMRNNNGSNNRGGGQQQQRRNFTNKNKVFDSNGPDVRIRGTAYQIVEKYLALAKDSASAGDRVLSESYLQYAEHYQRIINSWEDEYSPDPFDPRYEETYAAYAQYLAQKANQPAAIDTVAEDEMLEDDDLGLPGSIVAAPRMAEKELADA